MVASENTPLILESGGHSHNGGGGSGGAALASKTTFTTVLGTTQLILILCFVFGTGYDPKDYSAAEYVIFRDIAVMLFLGFGFLMTFLGKAQKKRDKTDLTFSLWCASSLAFFSIVLFHSHSLILTPVPTAHIG
jgi:hypothetical protein